VSDGDCDRINFNDLILFQKYCKPQMHLAPSFFPPVECTATILSRDPTAGFSTSASGSSTSQEKNKVNIPESPANVDSNLVRKSIFVVFMPKEF